MEIINRGHALQKFTLTFFFVTPSWPLIFGEQNTCFYQGVLSFADGSGFRLANRMSGINNKAA